MATATKRDALGFFKPILRPATATPPGMGPQPSGNASPASASSASAEAPTPERLRPLSLREALATGSIDGMGTVGPTPATPPSLPNGFGRLQKNWLDYRDYCMANRGYDPGPLARAYETAEALGDEVAMHFKATNPEIYSVLFCRGCDERTDIPILLHVEFGDFGCRPAANSRTIFCQDCVQRWLLSPRRTVLDMNALDNYADVNHEPDVPF